MSQKKFIPVAILLMLLGFYVTLQMPTIVIAADTQQSKKKIDEKSLAGFWTRPDGGYVLELKEFGNDGTLKASYFNPRSINVFKAEWNRKKGIINIFIELRDVNYPGSKYNLRYDPKTDRLKGTYFQAVQGETYDIEFIRAKK